MRHERHFRLAVISTIAAVAAFAAVCAFALHVRLTRAARADKLDDAAAGAVRTFAYVAVGDSYTCGTGVDPSQAWPAVLTRSLNKSGIKIELAANLGIYGITTSDAHDVEMPKFARAHPTFATLMIGVNDTYRTTSEADFRSQFGSLANAVRKSLPAKGRLIVLTIPDYSVTPTGAQYASMNDAKNRVSIFNGIIKSESAKRGLPVVDIFAASQAMGSDPTLVAGDGLHPSPKEHAIWAGMVAPVALKLLRVGAMR